MTGPLTDCQPARDNESEHAELVQHDGGLIGFLEKGDAAGLEENVQAAMASLEEQQHQELAEKAQEVEAALKTALGESRVTARTRRLMALRILEYDHFENEEAFVCSLIKERRSEKEQLELAKRLLIDDEAEDPRWIVDWVASELTPTERNLLTEVENRFSEVAKPRKRWWQFR